MDRERALGAIRRAHGSLCPPLERYVREAYGRDPAVADAVDGTERAFERFARRGACLLTDRVGYAAITGRDPPVDPPEPFDRVPETAAIRGILDDLADELGASGAAPGVIGTRYEEVASADGRDGRGQFFTPRPVAAALVGWALADGRERVLDPAAGTGRFLVAAYRRLRDRGLSHDGAVGRLAAVDVDAAALHLARLRLAAEGSGPPLDAHAESFFRVDPDGVGPVDAVVGNPPYVRAEDIDGDAVRRHLASFGPDGETPYLDGPRRLSGRSDAYVYFVTHATRFLREGGRLAMVLPTKWLASDYGEGFQRFLFDHYRVRAVVGFGARVFDDALVDTCLLLAERSSGAGDLRFVRLDDPEDATAAVGAIDDGRPIDGGRTIVRRQSGIDPGKLAPYLAAPRELIDLIEHPAFVPLSELADVSRGVMTGANRFFLLAAADAAEWDIDDRFLRPALKSMRDLDAPVYRPADVERYLVDAHGYVERVGARDSGEAKAALRRDGHDGLLAYVEHAEDEGWHAGRTCQARRVWFDLGDLPVPDAFVPKLLRERVFVIRNAADAVPSNAIDCLAVRDGVDPLALLGVLNSSLGRATMEAWGRDEAGMLQLMTYETSTLPVPDVRGLPGDTLSMLQRAAEAVLRGDGRDALDAAVIDAFDIGLSVGRLRALRERTLRRRVDGG